MRAPSPIVALACLAGGVACSDSTAYAVRNGPDAAQGGAAGTAGSSGTAGTGGVGGAAGATGVGGTAGSGGAAGGTAGSGGTAGGTAGSGGAAGGTAGSGGAAGDGGIGGCVVPNPVVEVDVGGTVVTNENEAALMPIVLSPIPSGGSRLAWMDTAGSVRVTTLNAADQPSGPTFTFPAHDLADLYADDRGGALLVSRDARGGGNLNCGTLANLCGVNLPSTESCYDMYLVRFDGAAETWASKLTDSTAALPPYSTGPTGPGVAFIWSAYAHHGRIATDGTRYAAYFGLALSRSGTCSNGGGDANGRGINIFQADRMKIVGTDGVLQTGGFDVGCSVSGYERVAWDPIARRFIAVCKTIDSVALPPMDTNVYTLDPFYGNLGNLVVTPGGNWLTVSTIQPGQPARASGLADVLLLRFATGAANAELPIAVDATLNERAPHLAAYGTTRLLAAWETSTAVGDLNRNDRNRKLYVQAFNATTGAPEGTPLQIQDVIGNRYQDFRSYPDGSVAYAAPGSTNTTIKIVRIRPCPP